MGEFPSGQRGQTVNLLLIASVVRIHLPPPNMRNPNFFPVGIGFGFFCLYQGYCILILYPLALCDYRTGGFFCLKVLLEVCCRIQYNYGKNDFISEVKRMGKYLMSQKSR